MKVGKIRLTTLGERFCSVLHGRVFRLYLSYLRCFVFSLSSSLVHFLLDEVVNSAVNRCIDPELMEPSVSEFGRKRGFIVYAFIYFQKVSMAQMK